MQNLLPHHSTKVQGQESLYFDQAQILKFKGDRISFASSGPLSILYFKEYDRFVLKLNDWKFPLIKRLPILSMDSNKSGPKNYILPASNGFLFKLTIENSTPQSLLNFESILKSNSCFALKGQETPFTKREDSPNDRLTRKISKDTGPIEIISQTWKSSVEKVKIAEKTLASGTLGVTSRKHKLDLNTLRHKNFKREAHSSLSKDFFSQGRQETQDFYEKRAKNINMTQAQPLYHLKRGPNLPIVSIFREDLEASILDNKDLASVGHFNLGKRTSEAPPETFKKALQSSPPKEVHESRGFFDALKQGLLEIKDTFSGLLSGAAGNESHEQDIGNLEPAEGQERPRSKSFTEKIKSGVNELLQDMSTAMHDSASNLNAIEKERLSDPKNPQLDETNPSMLYGMRNWEGLTHYQG